MIVNGKITKPVNGGLSIGEVATLFGCKADLGTICTDSHINPMSKIKPVIWPQWEPNRSGTWWKTANGMCGFRINSTAQQYSQRDVFTELSSLAGEFVSGRYHPWVYVPPTGGSLAPYRLLDFNGYYHYAQSPAGQVQTGMFDVQNGNTTIAVTYPDNDDGDSLTLMDFGSFSVDGTDFELKECYPGLMLINGTSWVASTSNTKFKSLTLGVWNDISFTGAGTVLSPNPTTAVNAIPFISSVNFVGASSVDNEDIDGVFMSAFGVSPTVITLHRYGTVVIESFGPESDEDLVWENSYVTSPMVISVATGTSATLHLATINLAKLSDAEAYSNGTITMNTFRDRYFDNSTVATTITLSPDATINMSIYAPEEDGFTPEDDWVCVLEASELTTPIICWTVINT